MKHCLLQNFNEERHEPNKVKFYFIVIDFTSLKIMKSINIENLKSLQNMSTSLSQSFENWKFLKISSSWIVVEMKIL